MIQIPGRGECFNSKERGSGLPGCLCLKVPNDLSREYLGCFGDSDYKRMLCVCVIMQLFQCVLGCAQENPVYRGGGVCEPSVKNINIH